MNDRTIPLCSAVAAALWILGLTLAILDAFDKADFGEVGIVSAMAGATFNIRGFLVNQSNRDRNAFELGRDHERSLRSIH